ncbi:hypothetical protein DmAi_21180 [Acetobacter persici]|uniref:Uncharacterized protein n=1 Tax=Acetobacter persici TaxID=1076596 RepID=A0A6V8I8W3_9PROT|nr:hypothetical protein DmAi_21180 [Acetobacter persici]
MRERALSMQLAHGFTCLGKGGLIKVSCRLGTATAPVSRTDFLGVF